MTYPSIQVGSSAAAYSHARVVGDLVLTSGMTCHDPATGQARPGTVGQETALALELLTQVLAQAGCTLADLVQVQVFLHDIDADYADFDAAYRAIVPAPYPPRATVGATLPGYKVEIIAIAAKPA